MLYNVDLIHTKYSIFSYNLVALKRAVELSVIDYGLCLDDWILFSNAFAQVVERVFG
jgi:hypothetical protein